MKSVAFEFARNYLQSFTIMKNSKVSLVQHEEPSLSKNIKIINLPPGNNFISKFVFAEYKQGASFNIKKQFIYFRICVPRNRNFQTYLDTFCPFSSCLNYEEFLNSRLACLNELSNEMRARLGNLDNTC